jgi:hypothetical protein
MDVSKSEDLQHMLTCHREEMLTFRNHPMSAVSDCLFSKFALSFISRVRILPTQCKCEPCPFLHVVLVERPERLGLFGRSKHRLEDNIQVDLHEIEWGALTGLIWFRMGTGGGHL